MLEKVQILAIVSLVIGILLLIASAIYLDDWKESKDRTCEAAKLLPMFKKSCEISWFFVVGASFGIIAALIQIGSTPVAFVKQYKLWCILHILIALAAFFAFVLPMSRDAYRLDSNDKYETRNKFYLGMTGLDTIFAVVAAGATFLIIRKQ